MKSIIRLFSKVDGKSKDIESIVDGSLSLDKAICTEYELKFGGCIASKFTTNIYEPVAEDYDRIQYIQIDNNVETIIFDGILDSLDTDDGVTTKITAYDDLSKEDNVASWYTSLFNDNTSILLSNLLKSLLTHLGINYNDITLKNDFSVTQTIMSHTIDCRDMLKWICELQGGFGYIEAGVFNIGYLQTSNPVELNVLSGFTKSKILSNKIDKVQLKSEEDDIGVIYGTGSNALIIQGNPLLYGKTVEELNSIAKKLFDNVKDITYIPYEAELPIGNPKIDLFKKYTIKSSNDTINSYILSTSLSGSRLVNQTIYANGTETRTTIVNDVNTELFVLDYKTNKIKKDIDGLNIEVQEINNKSDVLTKKVTDLTVNVDGISTKVETLQTDLNNTTDNITEVRSIAEQTADKFSWLVKSGTSATNFELTDRTATLVAEQINLNGLVTFSGLNSDTQIKINTAENTADTANKKAQGIMDNIYTADTTTINGGKITTGSIKASSIDVDNLDALAAKIGGFTILEGKIGYLESADYQDLNTGTNKTGYWNSFIINPETYTVSSENGKKVMWFGAHPITNGDGVGTDGYYTEDALFYPFYIDSSGELVSQSNNMSTVLQSGKDYAFNSTNYAWQTTVYSETGYPKTKLDKGEIAFNNVTLTASGFKYKDTNILNFNINGIYSPKINADNFACPGTAEIQNLKVKNIIFLEPVYISSYLNVSGAVQANGSIQSSGDIIAGLGTSNQVSLQTLNSNLANKFAVIETEVTTTQKKISCPSGYNMENCVITCLYYTNYNNWVVPEHNISVYGCEVVLSSTWIYVTAKTDKTKKIRIILIRTDI